MLFNTLHLLFALSISTLTNALPLDGSPRKHLVPRAKSYAIVNVDGGSTAPPEAEVTTTVVKEKTKTRTVEVTPVAPTVTDTIAVAEPTPAPTPTRTPTPTPSPKSSSSSSSATSTSASSSSSSQTSSTSTSQPPPSSSEEPSSSTGPSIVTVTITASDASPTEYYDNGLWHTRYAINSFDATVVTSVAETLSPSMTEVSSTSLAFPTLEPSTRNYNHTQIPRR
ncbi:hypothetical protein P154DRAFT_180915 [Amniculicola lignicola CBS 123094]|uniref:REJ domain-containing protein n=1 Tax=Amniculicola lignicola CBS 123094 TaxID=1392246 RepID=A0A6A5WZP8_9PLEO|nr:hypothetical protein P154DRAFT_180915 [Amniculicola lignicola CBS 123094]